MIVTRNRMIKPKKLKEFEYQLKTLAIDEMTRKQQQTLSGPVSLHLTVTFGDQRRRDIQNCFGSICDALNDVCYHDDSQIVEITGVKRYEKNNWEYIIQVETIE